MRRTILALPLLASCHLGDLLGPMPPEPKAAVKPKLCTLWVVRYDLLTRLPLDSIPYTYDCGVK